MDGGANFAVASGADAVHLCLFDDAGTETRVGLTEYDAGVWHGFVAGVAPGQAYGYRMTGPYEPARGLRYNPTKLLLDPYALAIDGEVRFGPEVLGYDIADPDRPSTLDSAAHVPRSIVRTALRLCTTKLRGTWAAESSGLGQIGVPAMSYRAPPVRTGPRRGSPGRRGRAAAWRGCSAGRGRARTVRSSR